MPNVGSALVAVVLIGLWWKDRERSLAEAERYSRQSRTAASISAALADSADRMAEAWKQTNEPERMRIASDLAHAAVRRAEGFAGSGRLPGTKR